MRSIFVKSQSPATRRELRIRRFPTQRASNAKPAFVMAPLYAESRDTLNGMKAHYNQMKQTWNQAFPVLGHMYDAMKIIKIDRLGPIFDFSMTMAMMREPCFGTQVHEVCNGFMTAFNCINPYTAEQSYEDILTLAGQVKDLGYEVNVLDVPPSGDKRRLHFLHRALERGLQKINITDEVDAGRQVQFGAFNATYWARDQWIKIDSNREFRRFPIQMKDALAIDEKFGEGGAMFPVGPKDWLMEKSVEADPRVDLYRQKGYRFFGIESGFNYATVLSTLLGVDAYATTSHIDCSAGGIPELKLVALNPLYYERHRLSTDLIIEEAGLKTVHVPKAECRRHPENFLPLGEGKVLVDSGAPEFIAELKRAGADPIPSRVPTHNILENHHAGLHCLFNEV